jgi:poly(3-hydroxybutyrate) depolymerase
MIAQYPAEIEAAAAIAGIGYPCADNLVKALSCMKNGSSYSIEKMVASINKPQSMHWPDLTLIAGNKDPIVNPVNSEQMAKQWQQLMATNRTIEKPLADGVTATRYQNTTTKSFVELVVVNELGHGWPINSQQPFGGEAAPFVLESSFSTTDYLVTNWGL